MTEVRIYYRPDGTVRRREHRADETYTAANVHPDMAGLDWIVTDIANSYDANGEIPFEALRVTGPAGGEALGADSTEAARIRQQWHDRKVGTGGRRDELLGKLAADTITDAEQRELLRLERGL